MGAATVGGVLTGLAVGFLGTTGHPWIGLAVGVTFPLVTHLRFC